MGAFGLYAYDTDDTAQMLRYGNLLYRADRGTCMQIVRIDRDTAKRQIYAGGYTTLYMLSRRVVTSEITVGNAEAGLYQLVSGNLRSLPVLNAASKSLADALESVVYGGERLHSAVQDVCRRTGLGARMRYTPGAATPHTFEVYKGADLTYDGANPYVVSAEFGNLVSMTTTEDGDYYKNCIIAKGKLTGGQEVSVRVLANASTPAADQIEEVYDTGLVQRAAVTATQAATNWWENDTQVVVKQAETKAAFKKRLEDAARGKLAEYTMTRNYNAKIDPADFGTLYNLGDVITCKSTRYGLLFDARVSAFTEAEDFGKRSLSVVLGTPEIDYIKGGIIKNG